MVGRTFIALRRHLAVLATAILVAACATFWSAAASAAGRLGDYLSKAEPAELVPGANRFGPLQGDPVNRARLQGRPTPWLRYLNSEFANATGYSGKPIQLLVGINPKGVLTGLKLVEHKEPIVLVGIPEKRILEAVNKLIGADMERVASGAAPAPQVDIVSGATVTVLVIGDSIVRSATKLIRSGRLGAQGNAAASAAPQASKTIDPGEKRNSRLAESGRRRLRPQTAPLGRRRQQGLREIRQCRRRGASGGGRSGRHLHRPLCR